MATKAVIQARMSSTRLRGKTLMPVAGITLLRRVIEMVRCSAFIDEVCVVTSSESSDDPVEAYCSYLRVPCFRGSKLNVFQRFEVVAQQMDPNDHIIRVTADNPFCQIESTAYLFEQHLKRKADYSCVKGLSHVVYEIISVSAFRSISEKKMVLSEYEQEHVTPVFRALENNYKKNIIDQNTLGLKPSLDKLLTIDTSTDLLRVEQLIKGLNLDNTKLDFDKVYAWLSNYTQLLQ